MSKTCARGLALSFCSALVSISSFAICVQSPGPCEWRAVHHGQPTFIGTVLSEEMVPDEFQRGEHIAHVTVPKVTFQVEETFEDMPEKAVDVYGFGTTNDFVFQVGTKYLVYGFRGNDGKIRTAKCTRTAPVSDATEDINFLRSLPTRNGGGIRGLVRFVSPGAQIGTVAGTITATGIGGDHKGRVAPSGWYELDGLAPGEYRERFTPDHDSTEFTSLKLSIPVNGSCAGSGVRLGNLTVSGRAIGRAGTPVAGLEMLLFYALDDKFRPEVALKTRTDRNGTFSFHRVEAAKYILVAESDLGTVFFPGTRDVSKAQVLEIHDGKPLSGVTIDLLSAAEPTTRK